MDKPRGDDHHRAGWDRDVARNVFGQGPPPDRPRRWKEPQRFVQHRADERLIVEPVVEPRLDVRVLREK